jgi:hypothetical protein
MLEPLSIDPDAVFDDGALYQTLGLTETALATARRAGTLRYARQGKRILYLGKWVLTWLESTAAPPPPSPAGQGAATSC